MTGNRKTRSRERTVLIPSGGVTLEGVLSLPEGAKGIVIFAHGAGSSRFSPRNQFVAEYFREGGLATLLFDLLTEDEAADRRLVFDIELLAERLRDATEWVKKQPDTGRLPLGYFGASTGAAAALLAAAQEGEAIRAVVSRGGRPDLAAENLPVVTAPTLLIVGGYDFPVIPLNEDAYGLLAGPKELKIIPRATHLFEEPGALEEVASLARVWFERYLPLAMRRAA
ncbi:MAG: dienelactone hydrolase family protein [Chloroflexi bacterium]|nr:dienelactone hydrolase family protein [Chloroflexota bacterium]